MLEKILEKVLDAMTPYLDEEQIEKLNNVLYLNFHGVEVKEECYELKPTELSGNAAKHGTGTLQILTDGSINIIPSEYGLNWIYADVFYII